MSGPLKWHGGKSYLANKIRALMPPHSRYCEPYFGGGAVLFSDDGEGVAEFANDSNGELINFWHCLRNPDTWQVFQRAAECTALSEAEFILAKHACNKESPDVSRAWCFFVRNRQSRQGLGKDYCTPTGRLRRGMNENVSAWLSAVDGLPEFHARLKRVEIRCQDALKFITDLDSPETCFYCDPPYLHETRSSTGEYGQYEMSPGDHSLLLSDLVSISGKFLLSGYRSSLYDQYAKIGGWRRVDFEIDNKASSAKKKEIKIESVWMNYDPQTEVLCTG